MPRSVLLGRVVQPGEPLFTQEDTDFAIALAEEEQDRCSSCGWPKAWCRDPANQFAFTAEAEQCHVTKALSLKRAEFAEAERSQQDSLQLSARFRDGYGADIAAGLDLPTEHAEESEHESDRAEDGEDRDDGGDSL